MEDSNEEFYSFNHYSKDLMETQNLLIKNEENKMVILLYLAMIYISSLR